MDDLMTQFPRSMALTDAAVYRLPRPTRRATVRDAKLPQLVLTIGPKSRAWYLHCTVHRRTHRVNLGRFPVVGAEDARRKALDALRKLYAGDDPRAPRQSGLTLAQALNAYLQGRKLRDSSAADCRGVIERHAVSWLGKPVAALSAEAVARQYRTIAAKSVSMANKMLRNLSAVVRHAAVAHGAGDPEVVKKARLLLGGVEALPTRDNVIPDALQPAWHTEVLKLPPPVRRLLFALALTGCRKEELRTAPSSAWNRETRELRIEHTKSGKPHTLPVGMALAAILDQCEGTRLFPVGEHELRTAYERVGAAIGNAWTPHDLRRGVATVAARIGVDELVIKRILNHAAQGVTQTHYIRLGVEDLRQPVQAIEDKFLQLWRDTDHAAA